MTAPEFRRGGKVRRVLIERVVDARCVTCGCSWSGRNAIGAGSAHAERAGHFVASTYRASYMYVPASGLSSTLAAEPAGVAP